MKVIDRYIIGKFLGTLSFMLILLSIIVVVVDVQQKSPRIEGNGFKVSYFLINYYPYWAIYLIITFMSILIFISVILFVNSDITTRELARYYIYAHHKGLKSLYYTRNKLLSVEECTSCSI